MEIGTHDERNEMKDWSSVIGPASPAEVEQLEDRLNAYFRANYGPLWGEENEREASEIRAQLDAAYDKHGIPEIDRIA